RYSEVYRARYRASIASSYSCFHALTRRPARSSLFPYRRSSDLNEDRGDSAPRAKGGGHGCPNERSRPARTAASRTAERVTERLRSEEHTSELQSRFDLVCRLLREKKIISEPTCVT